MLCANACTLRAKPASSSMPSTRTSVASTAVRRVVRSNFVYRSCGVLSAVQPFRRPVYWFSTSRDILFFLFGRFVGNRVCAGALMLGLQPENEEDTLADEYFDVLNTGRLMGGGGGGGGGPFASGHTRASQASSELPTPASTAGSCSVPFRSLPFPSLPFPSLFPLHVPRFSSSYACLFPSLRWNQSTSFYASSLSTTG